MNRLPSRVNWKLGARDRVVSRVGGVCPTLPFCASVVELTSWRLMERTQPIRAYLPIVISQINTEKIPGIQNVVITLPRSLPAAQRRTQRVHTVLQPEHCMCHSHTRRGGNGTRNQQEETGYVLKVVAESLSPSAQPHGLLTLVPRHHAAKPGPRNWHRNDHPAVAWLVPGEPPVPVHPEPGARRARAGRR